MVGYASLEDMQAWAARTMERTPDLTIGAPAYLERWWIVPRNQQQNVYLHRILRDDDDRALHDHPWENVSYVIAGRYREITPSGILIGQMRQQCDADARVREAAKRVGDARNSLEYALRRLGSKEDA